MSVKRLEPISISIATYRDLNAYKRCIDSVFRYTKMPFELILSCNGESKKFRDEFYDFSQQVQLQYPNQVKYIIVNRGNVGNGAHRNTAIKLANKYIAFLDDDALILGHNHRNECWLTTLYNVMQKDSKLAGAGGLAYWKEYLGGFLNLVEFVSLWRRDAWIDIGLKDETLRYPADEPDSNYRFLKAGWKLKEVKELNVYHPPTDLSKANRQRIIDDVKRFIAKWGEPELKISKNGLPVF